MVVEAKEDARTDFLARNLEALFRAYFNNKMMVILLMIQHPAMADAVVAVEKQRVFLQDLYHHFLPPGVPLKYHRAFRWLGAFLGRFPDVTSRQIDRALYMIGLIYEVFGLKVPGTFDKGG